MSEMKNWMAKVRLKTGIKEVRVRANSYFDAKAMIESMYGEGSIFFGPVES